MPKGPAFCRPLYSPNFHELALTPPTPTSAALAGVVWLAAPAVVAGGGGGRPGAGVAAGAGVAGAVCEYASLPFPIRVKSSKKAVMAPRRHPDQWPARLVFLGFVVMDSLFLCPFPASTWRRQDDS